VETVLALIIVLGVLIFVHELGHFLMAKAAGVRVLKFSLGFGPAIFSFTRGETEYMVAWVPLGGYVKMAGEDPEELEQAAAEGRDPQPGDFAYAGLLRRFGIIIAGPIMNIVLAFVVYFGVTTATGLTRVATTAIGTVEAGSLADRVDLEPGDRFLTVDGDSVDSWERAFEIIRGGIGVEHVVAVQRRDSTFTLTLPSVVGPDGGPVEGAVDFYGLWPAWGTTVAAVSDTDAAAAAGLEAGDTIIRLDGRELANWGELSSTIRASAGREVEIAWLREGVEYVARVTPARVVDDSTGILRGRLGITGDTSDLPVEHIRLGLGGTLSWAGRETWRTGTLIVDILARLVVGQLSMRETLGGPVTIARVARDSARSGILSLLAFVAFVSVNLGVLNLLPIPVLDGGHLVFLAAEALRGKPLSLRVRLIATQIGMAFIILIMLYVTVNDVVRLF